MCPILVYCSEKELTMMSTKSPFTPLPRAGFMWGVNDHERDHNRASCVTITSLFMFFFIIFNERLLSTGIQQVLQNLNLKFNLKILFIEQPRLHQVWLIYSYWWMERISGSKQQFPSHCKAFLHSRHNRIVWSVTVRWLSELVKSEVSKQVLFCMHSELTGSSSVLSNSILVLF